MTDEDELNHILSKLYIYIIKSYEIIKITFELINKQHFIKFLHLA